MRYTTLIILSLTCATACEFLRDDDEVSQARGMTSGSRLPPPQATGPRIAEVDIPTEPPFVGEDGVDAHGYPRMVPDQVSLLNLLRLGRFDDLERFMAHYQAAYEADWHKEYWPDLALASFYVADPDLAARIDEWIAAKPDSAVAWAARGNYRHRVAWHFRGERGIADTTPEQIAAMKEAIEHARGDFAKALELQPNYIAAHDRLIRMASLVGDVEAERAQLEAALAQCPTCFSPHTSYMHARETRWGGSQAELLAHAERAAEQASANPRLKSLLGYVALDRCLSARSAKQWTEAHAACDEALTHGDEVDFLVSKASVHVSEKTYAAAVPFLDRARKLAPQHRWVMEMGHHARRESGDMLGAARDLIVLRHLDPSDDDVRKWVENMVQQLRYDGQELNKAGKYLEAADRFALGLQLAPDDADMAQREAWNQKSIGFDDVQRQLAAAPDDFPLHLRVDHGFAASGRFDQVVEMWDVFVAAHPTDPRPFVERGGAKWHLGHKEEAVADMREACRLGMKKACDDVPKMEARLKR